MVNWSVLTADFLQAIILVTESSRRMVLASQSRLDFSAGTENIMWKELWLAKDFAISVVPRGRRRWSSPWLIWGLVPAGLSISDKICDFILVFWWRPGHPSFFSQKERSSLPSSVIKMLTSCKGEQCIPQASQQTSLLTLTVVLPKHLFLCWVRHILGNLYLFKTTLFLRTLSSHHLETSHALCCKPH